MGHVFHAYVTTGIAIAGAGLITVPAVAPPMPDVQVRAVELTSVDTADSSLGDGVALVVGPSGIPIPPERYADAVEQLYLAPRGFTGTAQIVDTPEALEPITGVKSLPFDTSEVQGQQILDTAILNQIASGDVDAQNPVVVFGYSQSSVIASQLMQELANQGVPSDDVHFVLVANESAPNGGSLSSFDLPVGTHPSVPALGVTFLGAEPNNLYPTDVYTLEYDGFADFPRYPIDELSTLNALFGVLFQHVTYADLMPEQIQDAIQLPTSAADTLTNYYMIPDQYLPLLEPLLLLPVVGKPLYELLEPDMRILVDLGYGSLTEGWNQGPADVPTPVGLFPTNIGLTQLVRALSNGAQQGITDAIQDLLNPATYQIPNIIADPASSPVLSGLVSGAYTTGVIDTANPSLLELLRGFLANFANFPISDATLLSSPTDIINDLTGTVSADYATLLPIADTVNALFTSLPALNANIFLDQLKAGNPVGGIQDLIGVDAGLIPFALAYAVVPPVAYALAGTLVNLVDLIPGLSPTSQATSQSTTTGTATSVAAAAKVPATASAPSSAAAAQAPATAPSIDPPKPSIDPPKQKPLPVKLAATPQGRVSQPTPSQVGQGLGSAQPAIEKAPRSTTTSTNPKINVNDTLGGGLAGDTTLHQSGSSPSANPGKASSGGSTSVKPFQPVHSSKK